MNDRSKMLPIRIIPVLLVVSVAAIWFADVEGGGAYVLRNLLPLLLLLLLALVTLYRGGGTWSGAGMRMPLGTLGFAIPALGLSAYLHYAYSVNLDGMFSEVPYPDRVFRYLPLYTVVAGGIGFAIGWIVGRNV
ncbi:MAG: hypothetical protein KJO95_00250 [Gammaproteobacteria bacterium]|nr:hypothetical protein [Gammaproteobacteria bacterium]MBU2678413.1 hypothetical protein [Gammaproteobacteria bacterium]NNC57957.1 hypothetical protein [Woeseiaceae bacterium]NNL52148.1 hypothetical protein [Woeseiaceae bacterium]